MEFEDENLFETYNDELSEEGSVINESDYEDFEDDEDSDSDSDIAMPRTGGRPRVMRISSSSDSDVDLDLDWSESDPRRNNENFLGDAGVRIFPENCESVKSVVSLFLSDEFFEMVTRETNRYYLQNKQKYREGKKSAKWKDVDIQEMKIFYALTILMGILNKPTIEEYWSTRPIIRTSMFSKAMPRDRFKQILQFLHFNNNDEMPVNNTDRLVKVRWLVDFFTEKFNTVYAPKQNLALDEAMIPWKGRLLFKTYNSSKIVKYGILCRMVCESDTAYISNFNIYTGTAGPLLNTVTSLLSPFRDLWHHVYMDNFYNSVNLAETLLLDKFRICGTIRVNRGLPDILKKVKLQYKQSTYRRKGEVLVQIWKDKKKGDVRMISTIHNRHFSTTTKRDRSTNMFVKKPNCVIEYNKYMKGVDRADQYLAFYSIMRKTRKWTKRVSFFLSNCALLNAFIVFQKLNPGSRLKYYNFLMTIAEEWLTAELPEITGSPSSGQVTPTPGVVYFDPPGRLSGTLRQHVLIKIFSEKKKKNVRRGCRVCRVNKKKGDTSFMCKFCGVPLHRGKCFDIYHTKKRHEREAYLNKVNLNFYPREKSHQRQHQLERVKKSGHNCIQGSLENVSINPCGEFIAQESSLRRSKSFAIAKGDVFASLDIPTPNRHRRSQLIPRAKLIDRSNFTDRRLRHNCSQENLDDRNAVKTKCNLLPQYGVPQPTIPSTLKRHSIATPDEGISQYIFSDEFDSLDSNFHNKTSINTFFRVSYENLACPDYGLNLPNYYPDSKCDTDLSLNENVSLSDSEANCSKKHSTSDNLSINNLYFETSSGSVSCDDNVHFSKQPKPKTFRQYTPFGDYFDGTPRSLPNFAIPHDDDLGPESDRNFDEINLNIDKICPNLECDKQAVYEGESIKYEVKADIKRKNKKTDAAIKSEITEEAVARDTCNTYKSVVSVDGDEKLQETKRHSHNYLKEFLETQKGSKRPLQNFITKKFSRAFGESRKPPSINSDQYHSLPDITASNNLRKLDKIDRKLRKCEKVTNLDKSDSNRFIVNIGRHFDVTGSNNPTVLDFEVKIKKITKTETEKEPAFLEAVKNLNGVLNAIEENPKLEEISANKPNYLKYKKESLTTEKKDKPKITPLPKISESVETKEAEEMETTNKEYQEKLDTMRNYWDKLAQAQNSKDEEMVKMPCKIVDVHSKVEEVIKKFEPKEEKKSEREPNMVQKTKQMFEPKVEERPEKLSPFIKESCGFFENPFYEKNQFESLNPNIVEIIEKDAGSGNFAPPKNGYGSEYAKPNKISLNQASKNDDASEYAKPNVKPLDVLPQKNGQASKLNYDPAAVRDPEFDHVRYRIVKSDLFHKNIFANCQKESQFDGLMQYLQDYSFQELLIDNNIVIIEPIRTKISHDSTKGTKSSRKITHLLHQANANSKKNLRQHFFYHPIRVNKEMNEDELPNPDTVKQVRQFFENGLNKSRSSHDLEYAQTVQFEIVDPDKDRCSEGSFTNSSTVSDGTEFFYDNELCCERQYVSEDILKKIRECGTSVTYYGGKVLNKRGEGTVSPITKAIMEEIRGNQNRDCKCAKRDGNKTSETISKDCYQGLKFKLLKSNSCSSRLELVGTNNLAVYRQKYLDKHKELIDQHNLKNQIESARIEEAPVENKFTETTSINLKMKKNVANKLDRDVNEKLKVCGGVGEINETSPKIVAEERKNPKMMQWGDYSQENKNYFTFNSTSKMNYNYDNYEKVKTRPKRIDDMEFEAYEIAGN